MSKFVRKEFISEKNHKGDRIAIVYHNGSQPPPLEITIIGGDGKTQSFSFDYLCLPSSQPESSYSKMVEFVNRCLETEKESSGG